MPSTATFTLSLHDALPILARQTLSQIKLLAKYSDIQTELITGGEDFKVQAARMRKNPDIILGTPGRLLEHREANNLDFEDRKSTRLNSRHVASSYADSCLK